MKAYQICEFVGRQKDLKEICTFVFVDDIPQNGDTVQLEKAMYKISGRHWLEDGTCVLIVSQPSGIVRC